MQKEVAITLSKEDLDRLKVRSNSQIIESGKIGDTIFHDVSFQGVI